MGLEGRADARHLDSWRDHRHGELPGDACASVERLGGSPAKVRLRRAGHGADRRDGHQDQRIDRIMRYAAVFMTWATLMLAYLVAGALLIPHEHRVAYGQTPKDAFAKALNALWWAVPLTWFLAPSVSTTSERGAGVALFVAGGALLIWAGRVDQFFIPV